MSEIDYVGEYGKWLDFLPRGLDDIARLSANPAHADRIAHFHFDDLTSDPVGTIRAVQEKLGMGYGAATEARLERYMADNPRNKKGEHRYSLEQFGLEPARLEEAFAGYLGRLDGYRRRVAA
jgi:hypothetical protein